jgi:hypothetical protein
VSTEVPDAVIAGLQRAGKTGFRKRSRVERKEA